MYRRLSTAYNFIVQLLYSSQASEMRDTRPLSRRVSLTSAAPGPENLLVCETFPGTFLLPDLTFAKHHDATHSVYAMYAALPSQIVAAT